MNFTSEAGYLSSAALKVCKRLCSVRHVEESDNRAVRRSDVLARNGCNESSSTRWSDHASYKS